MLIHTKSTRVRKTAKFKEFPVCLLRDSFVFHSIYVPNTKKKKNLMQTFQGIIDFTIKSQGEFQVLFDCPFQH